MIGLGARVLDVWIVIHPTYQVIHEELLERNVESSGENGKMSLVLGMVLGFGRRWVVLL